MDNSKKVLLVEDDEFTRYMMKEIIKTLGVDVEIANDGQQGVEILFQKPRDFGLVLMDLHMPRVSGIDATRMIRERRPQEPFDVPIVAVTADVTYHDDAVVLELGMNGFAAKPVTPGELLGLIDKYCVAA